MKKILVLSFLSVLLPVSIAMAATAKNFSGYLCDTLCYTNAGHLALDGTDMSTNPEKHAVACLKKGVMSMDMIKVSKIIEAKPPMMTTASNSMSMK